MAVTRQAAQRPERERRGGSGAELRPFVFLDKDGTLVVDVPYNADPERIVLVPGAGPALRALGEAGFGLAVVSNQSGVARGLFEEARLGPYRDRLRELLGREGVHLEAFLYCPHHPEGVGQYAIACDCRKPAPGMLLRAGRELGADLPHSWIVGDILDDVEAGHRAGCRAILLDGGHETEWRSGPERTPEATVVSLAAAAAAILERTRRGPAAGLPGRPGPVAKGVAA